MLGICLAACSGGGGKDSGAASPEKAADRLLAALNRGDQQQLMASMEPDRRKEQFNAQSFGILSRALLPIWQGRQTEATRSRTSSTSLQTDYQDDKTYASVHIQGTLIVGGSESTLDQNLLAVQLKQGWYVTTLENAYWKDLTKQQTESALQTRDPAAAAFAAQLDSDASIPGQYIPPHPGVDGVLCSNRSCSADMDDRRHVTDATSLPICTKEQVAQNKISDPFCYTSNPPTSGIHANTPAPFAILRQPASKESLVHNMEHGGVVVWYNTTDQKAIKQLEDIVSAELRDQKLVVMSFYTDMEPDTIALTSWTRLDKFPVKQLDSQRVQKFIQRNSRRFNPEGF